MDILSIKNSDTRPKDVDRNLLNNKIIIQYGSPDELFTPAYWKYICEKTSAIENRARYHLGESLLEEVVACLLGGHGIKGELGQAAFNLIKKSGILDNPSKVNIQEIEAILCQPINLNGRLLKYRFPRQKAKYIFEVLCKLSHEHPPTGTGLALRNWLTEIKGVGIKTASWSTRNWLDSDDVAIIDIHIQRASILMGLFSSKERVDKDYLSMESRFIQFAREIGIPTSVLDNVIWNDIRQTPNVVRRCLIEKGVKSTDPCGLPTANKRHPNPTHILPF